MSKKFKSQASSARAAPGFGSFGAFQTSASPLSYITELPDLSSISDPNVVVALKNLSKKDSTTKAKALDELLESLKESVDVSVLSAWSDLYPRTSIDNSQIVRRNAHVLQGLLTINAGKKIAPFLPKLVPSWLAGTFDSDKSVAKAASDALDKTFATPEKQATVWKVYKNAINERVEDALLVQTASTLSDERTTSPDEAQTKYVRVAGTALRLLSQLLSEECANAGVLQDKKLWEFVYHEDSYLRTAVCNLLLTVLDKGQEDLDWSILSTCLLSKGLNKSQSGSTRIFAQVLCKVTELRPMLWTSDYTAKTAVSKRLIHYLKQGSQNGPQDVWALLFHLLELVPAEVWKTDAESVASIAEAYRTGVLVERLHVDAAWSSYISACSWLSKQFDDTHEQLAILEQHMAPIAVSYVNKSNDAKWRIGGRAERTAILAFRTAANQNRDCAQRAWNSAVDSTIEKMRLSLPESSKDFRASQDAVIAQSKRLLFLQQNTSSQDQQQSVAMPMESLLNAAVELLMSRNGKPYAAASIIEDAVRNDQNKNRSVEQFVQNDLPKLLDSPSCEQLVSIALHRDIPIGDALLSSASPSNNILKGIQQYFRHAPGSQLEADIIRHRALELVDGFENDTARAMALSLMANPNLKESRLKQEVISRIVTSLSSAGEQPEALSMLEAIASQRTLVQAITASAAGAQISAKLLLLADTEPSLADRASALTVSLSSDTDPAKDSLPIINQQLQGEGEPLSILTLTDLGLKTVGSSEPQALLPSLEDWQKALRPHLDSNVPSSLAITSPLHGAVWTVDSTSTSPRKVIRDSEDFSLLFRIIFFVTKVFSGNNSKMLTVNHDKMEGLHQYYPIGLQLVNEKITLDAANDIWLGSTDEVLQAAADVLSKGSQLLEALHQNDNFLSYWTTKGHSINGSSRQAYLTSLAFLQIMTSQPRPPRELLREYESELQSAHRSDNILQTSTLLTAANEALLASQNGLKLANELIASVTHSPAKVSSLVTLNVLLRGDTDVLSKVPQQRLVFLFKSLVTQISNPASGSAASECLVLTSQVLPHVQEIYGEHWEVLIQALIVTLNAFKLEDIAVLHSSLLVYARLVQLLKAEEVNDDLQEAWTENKRQMDEALLHCLQSLNTGNLEVDQPRSITAELLRRRLTDVTVPENVDLLALLASPQPAVRGAAYDLLHQAIPGQQEQRSMELALDQKVSQLPDELLTLIGDMDDVQRYLFSWKVIFDHFPKASHKLREAYAAQIKSSGHVAKLLDFFCEKIRLTSGRPLDASKFSVHHYDMDMVESEEQGVQWLTVHLYYLTLMYLPSLARAWYLDQKNHIKSPLESWTQKHISPLVMASSLETVTEWSGQQSKDEADRPIEVKTSPRGTEIVASIPVDPESPPISISISLPGSYPLESPSVQPRSRVGVSEKNWNSWLRTIQIIILSSGSIIEGLVAFRRNVQGALKGQSECAICYSIIGTDMQTPNKKCGTCKNMFHGVCLFRWFKSSNSSSCPLCRNNFNYA